MISATYQVLSHFQRSVVNGRVDDAKTDYYHDHVLVHSSLLKVLLEWAEI